MAPTVRSILAELRQSSAGSSRPRKFAGDNDWQLRGRAAAQSVDRGMLDLPATDGTARARTPGHRVWVITHGTSDSTVIRRSRSTGRTVGQGQRTFGWEITNCSRCRERAENRALKRWRLVVPNERAAGSRSSCRCCAAHRTDLDRTNAPRPAECPTGRSRCSVPDLTCLSYDDARRIAEGPGLKTDGQPDGSAVPGRVTNQDPEPGASVAEGAVIQLEFKPTDVTVPDLVGLDVTAATGVLAAAPLRFDGNASADGVIVAQIPAASESAIACAAVMVELAIPVPSLIGVTFADARQKVRDLGLIIDRRGS